MNNKKTVFEDHFWNNIYKYIIDIIVSEKYKYYAFIYLC